MGEEKVKIECEFRAKSAKSAKVGGSKGGQCVWCIVLLYLHILCISIKVRAKSGELGSADVRWAHDTIGEEAF